MTQGNAALAETADGVMHVGCEDIQEAFTPLEVGMMDGPLYRLRLATPADYERYCQLQHPSLYLTLTPEKLATMTARGIHYQPGEPGLIPLVMEDTDSGQLVHRSYLLSRHVDDTSSPHLCQVPGGWQALSARERYGAGNLRIMDWGGALTLPQYGKRGSCVASLIVSLALLQTLTLRLGAPADLLNITVIGALPAAAAGILQQRLRQRTGKPLECLSSSDGVVLSNAELAVLAGPDWTPGQPHAQALGTARACQHLLDCWLRCSTQTYAVPFSFHRDPTIHARHGGPSYVARVQ